MITIPYPMIDMASTGRNIRLLRQRKGYPIKEVSQFMGFPAPTAGYRWEQGAALPTVDHLYALSRLPEVPMDDILIGQ